MHRDSSDLYRRLLEHGASQDEIERVYRELRQRGYGEEAARARAERAFRRVQEENRKRRSRHGLENLGERRQSTQAKGQRSELDRLRAQQGRGTQRAQESSGTQTSGGDGEAATSVDSPSQTQTGSGQRSTAARGKHALAWSPLPGPQLRRRINAHAFHHRLLITGVRERLQDFVSYFVPNAKDYANPRLIEALAPAREFSQQNPYDYSLVETLQALRSCAAIFLGAASKLSPAAPSPQALKHSENQVVRALRRREPFVEALLAKFAAVPEDLIDRLAVLEARAHAGRRLEPSEFLEIARGVYELTLSTEGVKADTLRYSFEIVEDVLLAYGHMSSAEIRRLSEVFVIARDNLQSYARELYPVALRAVNEFYELGDTSKEKQERLRAFARLSDEDILTLDSFRRRQTKEKEQRLLEEQEEEVSELERRKEERFGTRFAGILQILGSLFPESEIEYMEQGIYLLPYFDRRVFNKSIPFTHQSADIRVIAREDPLQPVFVLHRIGDNLISSIDPGHLARIMDREDLSDTLVDLTKRWKAVYNTIFDPYVKAITEYRRNARDEEYIGEHYMRSIEEQINQLRNRVFHNYGHIMLDDTPSAGEPLYETVSQLSELLGEIGSELNADLVHREDPIGKRTYRQLEEKPVVDFSVHAQPSSPDCKPVMRQLRRYIEAKYGNRIHAIPKLSQLFFLDFVRAFVDMYCSLLEDEESFPRRTGERVPVAGDAERTVWKQEQQHRGRAASELLHIRLKEEQESGYLDGLTGLRNKEYYLKKLQSDYAEIRKRGLPVSLMMLDIDHFKWINDEFGHPKGDEVLSDIGQTIQEHIRRSNDVPIRYGGEEVLILFQAPVHTALLSAERLRDRQARHLMERELYEEIRELGARHEDSCGTLSVGVVDASRSAGLEEAIGEADKALYRAKQDRNRAVLGRKDSSGALQLISYEDYAKELRAKRSSGGAE